MKVNRFISMKKWAETIHLAKRPHRSCPLVHPFRVCPAKTYVKFLALSSVDFYDATVAIWVPTSPSSRCWLKCLPWQLRVFRSLSCLPFSPDTGQCACIDGTADRQARRRSSKNPRSQLAEAIQRAARREICCIQQKTTTTIRAIWAETKVKRLFSILKQL